MIRESHKNKSVLNGSKPFYKFQNRSIYIKTVLYYLCPSCMVTTNRSHTSSKRSKSVLVIMLYTRLWLFVHLHGHIVNIYTKLWLFETWRWHTVNLYTHLWLFVHLLDILSIYIQNYEYLCLYGIYSLYIQSKKVVLGTENLFCTAGNHNRSMANHFFLLLGRWETISGRRKPFLNSIVDGNLLKLLGRRDTISGLTEIFLKLLGRRETISDRRKSFFSLVPYLKLHVSISAVDCYFRPIDFI